MKILAIDTATENCSAALLVAGELRTREVETERQHAELILPMVDELLKSAGIALKDLDAIAFGRGPGAFTGVRLATSVAQGLAFGAGLPVVPVSDLQAVAQRVLELEPGAERVLVCNDARMREVYWACFARGANGLAEPVNGEHVSASHDVVLPAGWVSGLHGAGRGFRAHPDLAARFGSALAAVHDQLLPAAAQIARLAASAVGTGQAVDPADAHPVYLRDDVARPPS